MAYIFYLICGSICCYISCMFLLPKRLHWWQKTIVFLYILWCTSYLNQYIGQMITLVNIIGIMILLAVFTNCELLSLICSLTGYLYAVSFNYLFQWLTILMLHISTENWLSNHKLAIGFSVFYCFFCGITLKLSGDFLRLRLKENEMFREKRLMTGLFIYLMMLTFLFILNISYGESLGYSYGVIALSGIIFLSLFFLTVFLLTEIYKIALQIQQKKNQMALFENMQSYTKKLEDSYGAMRRFKHDYLNILSTLDLFMKEDNMPALKAYYYDKILQTRHEMTKSDTQLESLSRIQNTELKSLVSSKLIYSIEAGIKTEIEVKEPVCELFMDSLVLARVLGIFLDNAVEAALEAEDKRLHFCMAYQEDSLIIVVRNTSKPLAFPLSIVNKAGISGKGENRGIGLYNAEELLNACPNVIWDTAFDEPWFMQCLTITQ